MKSSDYLGIICNHRLHMYYICKIDYMCVYSWVVRGHQGVCLRMGGRFPFDLRECEIFGMVVCIQKRGGTLKSGPPGDCRTSGGCEWFFGRLYSEVCWECVPVLS